jgi:hypothetical protein
MSVDQDKLEEILGMVVICLAATIAAGMGSMAGLGAGRMQFNVTSEGDEDGVRASCPAETRARLAAPRAHYDPGSLSGFNQNIRPAQAR